MQQQIRKLRYVQSRDIGPRLKLRVARLIDAVSNSNAVGVSAPIDHRMERAESALSKLEDNSDSYLALMRTLPKKHPFKKIVGDMAQMADSLVTKMTEAGTELEKILSVDEDDLPGIKASALGALSELIKEESGKLAGVQELASLLSKLAGRANKEEATSPVEHSLPEKEVGGKKKDTEEQGIGEMLPEVDNAAGTPESAAPPAPPSSTPNLSAF